MLQSFIILKNAERRRRETALQEFAPYFALLKKILASFEKYMDVFFKCSDFLSYSKKQSAGGAKLPCKNLRPTLHSKENSCIV